MYVQGRGVSTEQSPQLHCYFFILFYLQTQMNIRESEMIYLIGAQGGFLERREWGAVSFS